MTITNNRGDTPLHNAARWNHPALVNELLLYGARYTATNNDNRTPRELTSDEGVQELIWKAGKGIIAVGSYSPLNRRTPDEVAGSIGSGREGFSSSGGSSVGGEKHVNSNNTRVSGNSYFQPLERRKLSQRASKSPDILEEGEESGSHDIFDHHDFVMIEDPLEHRPLGAQQGSEVTSVGQSSEEDLLAEKPGKQQPHPLQRPHPKEEEPQQRPHPKEEEPQQRPHPKEEGPQQRPHPKEEDPMQRSHPKEEEPQQRPHPKGEGPQHKPHPKRDEKLRSLLMSIEGFDR